MVRPVEAALVGGLGGALPGALLGAVVGHALDRHWRNARTVSSHNPVIYKARDIGDWKVNGTPPTGIWQIGRGEG